MPHPNPHPCFWPRVLHLALGPEKRKSGVLQGTGEEETKFAAGWGRSPIIYLVCRKSRGVIGSDPGGRRGRRCHSPALPVFLHPRHHVSTDPGGGGTALREGAQGAAGALNQGTWVGLGLKQEPEHGPCHLGESVTVLSSGELGSCILNPGASTAGSLSTPPSVSPLRRKGVGGGCLSAHHAEGWPDWKPPCLSTQSEILEEESGKDSSRHGGHRHGRCQHHHGVHLSGE